MSNQPGHSRVIATLEHAPLIALAMWGPYIAVRLLDSHHASGTCSCTELFTELLPIAPGFLPVALIEHWIGRNDPSRLIAGIVSFCGLLVFSRLAAIGRIPAWITVSIVLVLSTYAALGLSDVLTA